MRKNTPHFLSDRIPLFSNHSVFLSKWWGAFQRQSKLVRASKKGIGDDWNGKTECEASVETLWMGDQSVVGQSWILSWRPLDWFIWTLEKTESTRGRHNATQRAHYASERDHCNARLKTWSSLWISCSVAISPQFEEKWWRARLRSSANCPFFSFSCILLQLQPFDMDDDSDYHNDEDDDDDNKLRLLQNKNTGGISLARWSRCGAFFFFWHRSRTSDQLLQMAPLCNTHRYHHHSRRDHKVVLAQ